MGRETVMDEDKKYQAAKDFIKACENLDYVQMQIRGLKEKISEAEDLYVKKQERIFGIYFEIMELDNDLEYDYDDRNVRNRWYKNRGILQREDNIVRREIEQLERDLESMKTRLSELEAQEKEAEKFLKSCDKALAALYEGRKREKNTPPSQPGGPS